MCVCYLHVIEAESEDKHTQNAATRVEIENISVLCLFLCVDGKNPKPKKLSPVTDNAIT